MAVHDPDAPSSEECTDAMTRALWSRVKAQHGDHPHMTRSAMLERITAIPVRPEPSDDGWWRLGVIFDDLAGQEFNVWYRPRGLTLSLRRQAEMKEKEPPRMVPPDEAATFRNWRMGRGEG